MLFKYKKLISLQMHEIILRINNLISQNKIDDAIVILRETINKLNITDYLLTTSNPEISKELFVQMNFSLGCILKNKAHESQNISLFKEALVYFRKILSVIFEHEQSVSQIVSIYTNLCFLYQDSINVCMSFLQEALLIAPHNETIHYNLGYIYNRINRLELSLIHFKTSIALLSSDSCNISQDEKDKLYINNYNGIANLYRSIKQWPESLYFLQKAEKVINTDPDIQNQLGIVYTEMRRTDLAEIAYENALKYVDKACISANKNALLSDIHLNYGHMHSYNGDNNKAIEEYNKSLKINPSFNLPFQNKLMNLSYVFDEFEDPMYILNQHKLINKVHPQKYTYTYDNTTTSKINIGIISGDFTDHPVSYFIKTLLKKYNPDIFNITCYSECIINTDLFNKNIKFTTIKGLNTKDACDLINSDNIHILLDLAGHTAFNRLDVFANAPAPIQISYIGYPYSTGLKNMHYRITDKICDNPEVSQKFYTEKLLYLENCFLCYDSDVNRQLPKTSPFVKNGYITFGCYNRLNKITDNVIKIFNKILLRNPKSKFIFKTKALLNNNIKNTFLEKFDHTVRHNIKILDCTILHEQHLDTYSEIDIAIDTFPYSGTTTSCEALNEGVPVFTIYDSKYYFHAQNVTASILKNSNLEWYIANNQEELLSKISDLNKKDNSFWKNLKTNTKNSFQNGLVCNQELYIKNISKLLIDVFSKNKIENK